MELKLRPLRRESYSAGIGISELWVCGGGQVLSFGRSPNIEEACCSAGVGVSAHRGENLCGSHTRRGHCLAGAGISRHDESNSVSIVKSANWIQMLLLERTGTAG